MKVFVYGTLKRGGTLHDNISRFEPVSIEPATIKGATMYDLGSYPAIVFNDPHNVIPGEVVTFEGNEGLALHRLDMVEGYPGLYDRKITLTSLDTFAWVYHMTEPPTGLRVIPEWEICDHDFEDHSRYQVCTICGHVI